MTRSHQSWTRWGGRCLLVLGLAACGESGTASPPAGELALVERHAAPFQQLTLEGQLIRGDEPLAVRFQREGWAFSVPIDAAGPPLLVSAPLLLVAGELAEDVEEVRLEVLLGDGRTVPVTGTLSLTATGALAQPAGAVTLAFVSDVKAALTGARADAAFLLSYGEAIATGEIDRLLEGLDEVAAAVERLRSGGVASIDLARGASGDVLRLTPASLATCDRVIAALVAQLQGRSLTSAGGLADALALARPLGVAAGMPLALLAESDPLPDTAGALGLLPVVVVPAAAAVSIRASAAVVVSAGETTRALYEGLAGSGAEVFGRRVGRGAAAGPTALGEGVSLAGHAAVFAARYSTLELGAAGRLAALVFGASEVGERCAPGGLPIEVGLGPDRVECADPPSCGHCPLGCDLSGMCRICDSDEACPPGQRCAPAGRCR